VQRLSTPENEYEEVATMFAIKIVTRRNKNYFKKLSK
jgi:hypothetical protein